MFAPVAAFGTPAIQLPGLNQPLENAPVQLVWACVETVDAAKSAIVASNLDETNLQPAPAPDVAPRAVLWTTVDAVRTPYRPQSIGASLRRGREQNPDAQAELANQQSHNRPPDCRNCGDGECSFIFLIADALRPRNGQQCRPSWLASKASGRLAGFSEGQNVAIEFGWAGLKQIGSSAFQFVIEKLVPPPVTERRIAVGGLRAAITRRPHAPAASAQRSGVASINKFDAARIPVPPHHMAVLCRFETIE